MSVGFIQVSSGGVHNYTLGDKLFPDHQAYNVPDALAAGLSEPSDAVSILEGLGQRLSEHLATFDDPDGQREFYELCGRRFDRWQEIADLCNGAAQSANLAVAAMCECAGLLSSIPLQFRPGDAAIEARWNALRLGFTLEATSQYLVSIGHYLTNIALRVAVDDPRISARRSRMTKRLRLSVEAAMVVGTQEPAGWVYHATAPTLVDQLGGRSRSLKPLRITATLYRSRSWSPMATTRNEAFHRLREEFPSRGAATNTSGIRRSYLENHRAMRALGRALPNFVTAVEHASPRPRGGPSKGVPLAGTETIYEYVDGVPRLKERPSRPFRG